VVNAELRLSGAVENLLHAPRRPADVRVASGLLAVFHVNVRDLVIRDGEGPAGARVEQLQTLLLADANAARFPQNAIDRDCFADGFDAVFADDDHAHALAVVVVDQISRDVVDLGDSLRDFRIARA
jgi:hypothetical protein